MGLFRDQNTLWDNNQVIWWRSSEDWDEKF